MVPPTRRKAGTKAPSPRIMFTSRTTNKQPELAFRETKKTPELATRSTRKLPELASRPTGSPAARAGPARRPVRAAVDVIVLSSDDDDDYYAIRQPAPKRKASKSSASVPTPGAAVPAQDVERELALAQERAREKAKLMEKEAELALVRVQRENVKRELREVKEKHAQTDELCRLMAAERDEAIAHSNELESTLKRKAETAFPDASSLEDMISCEICTTKMWAPATLQGCSHTFCESCLHGWFNMTYTTHVTAHPHFLEGPLIPTHYEANRHDSVMANTIAQMRRQWERRVPQPVYTCPTCRVQVKERPLEIYFLKEVVRKVARVLDPAGRERSPPVEERANRAVGGIWDGFFPNK